MIVNDRITEYIHSLDRGNGELCDSIEKEALKGRVPIIRKETAALLKTLIAAKRPHEILEVGTAVGYSALLMSRVMPAKCHITTIEKYEPRIPVAKENFRKAGMEDRITLLEGDAEGHLKQLSDEKRVYDFIFMDAAKGQYLHWLPMILSMLPEGGMLFSDNVFQDGDIVESRYAVERRDRTIHRRMREYLYVLTHHEQLETSLIPIGDGTAVSVKVQKNL
ncbi:O-methyltransferase [Clostridium sp. AM58-1XD]|uniref:O-methyltransferase n=1 Tax=Clostridium sp. AM58-1XD TaxID=2292307 RepID=UPI000E537DB1|nr:O-methyltransferase [Clostridium sp. AM58-1XD]RGY97037.1 O-methyltransferase [Clostridium sp. AM58-1XD]